MIRRIAVTLATAFLVLSQAAPAHAIHLFPLVPGDPTGDCAAKMKRDPGTESARVTSEVFFFVDDVSNTSTTTIRRGQSVTWRFLRFCHSVTAVTVPKGAKKFTTFGGKGSAKGPVAGQDRLVKPFNDNSTYTMKFTVPGTYRYECIHHAAVGMTGTVVVTKGAPPAAGNPVPAPPIPNPY